MHNHKIIRFFLQKFNRLIGFLPSLFWVLLIFGFDDIPVAFVTILCALIHELGHAVQIKLNNNSKIGLRTTLCGFRMKRERHASYLSDAMIYFSGPLYNFISAILIALLPFFNIYIKQLFTTVSLATAFSNLLPIKGYDGYGIACSLACHFGKEGEILPLLDNVSFCFLIGLTFVSLYIVTRIGSSYWMAGLFIISLIREIADRLKNVFTEI